MKNQNVIPKTSLVNQHKEYQQQTRSIEFMRDELRILNERLDEVSTRNNGREFLQWTESYQNKFIVLRENLDTLNHELGLAINKLEAEVKSAPTHVNEATHTQDEKMRLDVEQQEKSFHELKSVFNRFVSKHM